MMIKVLFGTRQQMEKLKESDIFEIKIGNEKIKPSPSARNLGFYMESQLKSQTHIAKVCGTAYYTLKNVARIHNLLTPEAAKIIVQGLVISKLDYCNGLLLGISNHQLNKLQIVQNMGCRVIKTLRKFNHITEAMKTLRKFDHITEAMKDLHWLKIPECIQFKILVTIYQCVNGLAPSFLIDLLDLNLMRRNLRSDTQGKLPIPQCNLSQVCNSSIRYAGPRLWNELPQNLSFNLQQSHEKCIDRSKLLRK